MCASFTFNPWKSQRRILEAATESNGGHLIPRACSWTACLIYAPLTVHVFCWQSLCYTLARRGVLQRKLVGVFWVLRLLFFFPLTGTSAGWLTSSSVHDWSVACPFQLKPNGAASSLCTDRQKWGKKWILLLSAFHEWIRKKSHVWNSRKFMLSVWVFLTTSEVRRSGWWNSEYSRMPSPLHVCSQSNWHMHTHNTHKCIYILLCTCCILPVPLIPTTSSLWMWVKRCVSLNNAGSTMQCLCGMGVGWGGGLIRSCCGQIQIFFCVKITNDKKKKTLPPH